MKQRVSCANLILAILCVACLANLGCAGVSSAHSNATESAPTLSINGTITPAANGGGVTVTLSGAASATTTTDSNGNYSFADLSSGKYTLTPSKTSFSFTPSSQSTTLSTTSVTGMNFTVSSGSGSGLSISGNISPSISGATVSLSGAVSATTVTDSNGDYSFGNLVSGNYTLTPSETGFSFSPSSQSTTLSTASVTGVNFTASATSGLSISGNINPATSGSGVTVSLSGAASATTTTDSNGNYTFTGLANGNYTLTPSKSGFSFSPSSQSTVLSVASATGVNFTASSGSGSGLDISGNISPAANGTGVTVFLSGAVSATTVTDSNGNYSFGSLASGTYTLTPSKSGFNFSPLSQSTTLGTTDVTGVNFSVYSQAAIVASQFFAVNDVSGAPEPQVTYGLLGHPVPLAWQEIEQTQGVYDFTQFDPFVQIAPKDASGTALMVMTLGKTPPWAASDSTTCEVDTATDTTGCTSPPSNIQDWTDFITALLAHYNGVTEPHVKYYEIWNEVNSHWAGTAAQMEQLAAAAYPIIRQDPYSSVVGPSVSGNIHGTGANDPMVWLNSYLQAGGVHYQDIMSFHGFVYNSTVVPYPLPTEDCSASDANCGGAIQVAVELYNQVLQNNGVGTRPMFNTEGGFEGATLANTDTAEAWLAQYYALEVAMANTDNMQQVSWFTWGAPAGQLETTSGAVSPVGTAYDQLYAWFVGTVPVGACVNTGNLWTCSITGQNGYQGEVIWDQSQTCSPTCTTANQTVPSVYTDYRDLSGNATPITNSTVPVGLKPILLEN